MSDQRTPDQLAICLEAVAGQIRRWLEWHKNSRDREHLTTDSDTAIRALPVPMWPTHGQFEAWIKLFDDARASMREIERLRVWVADLQSGMFVNCVYCGHRYGPGETTPVTMADALKAHVAVCPEHPMSGLLTSLKALLHEIVFDPSGDQTQQEFDAMIARAEEAIAKVAP